jgi:LPPG:FO 2-phospho-L-lactate transferase
MSTGATVLLAGGVGGAKLAHGLQSLLGARLTVIVNTGDDLERYGLAIWPDLDTVLYTLAGRDDRARGWGLADESWTVMGELEARGDDPWFRLGDRDLATHLLRTGWLREGMRPTEVATALRGALDVTATVLPMSDDPVATEVRTDEGWLAFQEYFVHQRQEPAVHEVRFVGVDRTEATPEIVAAIADAETVVIAPSNPIVSIRPILRVPGVARAIQAARAGGVPVVAVSPIVGGRALKGPADRMLASLGHDPTALGVARLYVGTADGFVLDQVDAALADDVAAAGLLPLVTDTIMTDDAARAAVAGAVLDLADRLAGRP